MYHCAAMVSQTYTARYSSLLTCGGLGASLHVDPEHGVVGTGGVVEVGLEQAVPGDAAERGGAAAQRGAPGRQRDEVPGQHGDGAGVARPVLPLATRATVAGVPGERGRAMSCT